MDNPYYDQKDRVFSNKLVLNYSPEWLELIEKENKFQIEKIYKGKYKLEVLNLNLVRIF